MAGASVTEEPKQIPATERTTRTPMEQDPLPPYTDSDYIRIGEGYGLSPEQSQLLRLYL
jgi:hypothetical protein